MNSESGLPFITYFKYSLLIFGQLGIIRHILSSSAINNHESPEVFFGLFIDFTLFEKKVHSFRWGVIDFLKNTFWEQRAISLCLKG